MLELEAESVHTFLGQKWKKIKMCVCRLDVEYYKKFNCIRVSVLIDKKMNCIRVSMSKTNEKFERTCKGTPSRFPDTKVQMAGSEPLIQEADPHITKFAMEARM